VSGTVPTVIAVLACLVAVIVAAIAVAVILRTRRHPNDAPGAAPPTDPFASTDVDALRGDPRTLKPGDIAEIRGRSHAVRGTLRFTEGSWGWAEHLLDDVGGNKMWLSVEEDPDLELVLWTEVPTATVLPGPPSVDFDGRRYARDESGHARYTATGTTGLNPTGTVEYHDYAAPDGALLSFERYGDSDRWEVGRGERLHRAELHIYSQAG
jgi:hypothetical protein